MYNCTYVRLTSNVHDYMYPTLMTQRTVVIHWNPIFHITEQTELKRRLSHCIAILITILIPYRDNYYIRTLLLCEISQPVATSMSE